MAQEVPWFVGDQAAVLQITVTEDGSPVDIGSASTKQIKIRKPDGELLTKTATFVTNGTDGKIKYALASGDIDEPGIYEYQAFIIDATAGINGHTVPGTFPVEQVLTDTT